MLKRVTACFALFCVMSAAGLAQQKLVVSNSSVSGSRIQLSGNLPQITSMTTYNPYRDIPEKLAVDTTINIIFTTSAEDIPLSDTSRTIVLNPGSSNPDTIPIVLTFAPTEVGSANGKLYDIVGFFQPVEPFPNGRFRIDSIFTFIFRLGGSSGANMRDDIYLIPLVMPSNTNLSNYNVSINRLTFNDEMPFYIIDKDSLNSPARYPQGSIQGLMVPTPGMVIEPNTKFGMALVSAGWFDDQFTSDTWGIIATHDWDVPAEQTYGGLLRRNTGAIEDTVQNIYAAELAFGQGPRIKQNFIIRMFGEYSGEWPIVTDVRPDPNGNSTGLALEANFPNPASDETHVRFTVDKTAPVTLRLTNMLGQIVETSSSTYNPGSYVWDVKTSHLPTGTYIYSLSIGDRTLTRTMTVAR